MQITLVDGDTLYLFILGVIGHRLRSGDYTRQNLGHKADYPTSIVPPTLFAGRHGHKLLLLDREAGGAGDAGRAFDGRDLQLVLARRDAFEWERGQVLVAPLRVRLVQLRRQTGQSL